MNSDSAASFGEILRLGDVREAAGMRISAVECLLYSYRYPPEDVQRWSGGTLPGVTLAVVRVRTEEGLFGLGETYAGNFAPKVVLELVRYFEPLLVGRDPSAIAELWQDCYSRIFFWGRSGIAVSVLGGIESALWDLCGKAVGKPVVELLGGSAHSGLPRYASGGMEASDEALAAEQVDAAARGFKATKIRGGDSPERDAHRYAVAREALPASAGLAIDAVQGSNPDPWPAEIAIAMGREIEQFDPLWLEEPCAANDHAGYARCRRELAVPIAGGETATTLDEFQRFFDHDALDIAQPDTAHAGGILAVRVIAAAAERAGVRIAVHSWLGAGSVMANYHTGFASPNCDWLEFPIQPNPFVMEMLAEPLTLDDGLVRPPTLPGLGIVLPDDLGDRYPYQAGCHYHFGARGEEVR